MANFSINLQGRIIASIKTSLRVFGRQVEGSQLYQIRPGTGEIILDDKRLIFRGRAKKEGMIYTDIKREEIKSFFLAVHDVNIPLVVGGGIMLTLGVIFSILMLRLSLIMFFLGLAFILPGVIMLVIGLLRSVVFSIRTTNHLFDFITLIVRGFNQSHDFSMIIEEYWRSAGQASEYQPSSTMPAAQSSKPASVMQPSTAMAINQFSAPASSPQPASRVVNPPAPEQAPANLTWFTCNVCYEDFQSQEQLLEHKSRMQHW